jgi:hypothetical protein
MKIPLVVKDIETRTEDPEEKAVISKILEFKESSLRKNEFSLIVKYKSSKNIYKKFQL